MLFFALVAVSSALAYGIDLGNITTSREPIVRRDPKDPSMVEVTLRIGAARFAGEYSAWVRAYVDEYGNPYFPGPVIRFRRGDLVRIKLINMLDGEIYGNNGHNEFSHPNVTNLHTHGLHISSLIPADNVLIKIYPGEEYNYGYEIPHDHLGGTHWYHPHIHGSTGLQEGGGAHGMIIIEDEEGDVDVRIANMAEQIMIMSHFYVDFFTKVANGCQDELFEVPMADNTNYFAVNGKYMPTIQVMSSKYTRFRFLNAGWAFDSALRLYFESPNNCVLQLIAKDGVYLAKYPRTVTEILLPMGTRADIAVRCPETGTFTISSKTDIGQYGYSGPIFNLEVLPNGGMQDGPIQDGDFEQKDYFLPEYLTDLRHETSVDDTHYVKLEVIGEPDDPASNYQFNGKNFPGEQAYEHKMKLGSLQEWTLDGIDLHPFHIHINHFQLVNLTSSNGDPVPWFDYIPSNGEGSWFQPGDWHDTLDTLKNPLYEQSNVATIRFRTNEYHGPVIMHCHILPHEDLGMMGVACIYKEHSNEVACQNDCLMEMELTKCLLRCDDPNIAPQGPKEDCYDWCVKTCPDSSGNAYKATKTNFKFKPLPPGGVSKRTDLGTLWE
jgi:FtsP/CotA-like multicopper oxidase with cupredoxin domain